ncbi:MAG: response regulator transcription factor [Deltaproteobacteria bacterium]|nr:response regulator transcription factor [Deltaproteobacteria bacterium]MBI3293461.1 response regulator transcription factor [Deltaproteobacteria bacterium]
MSSQILVVEDDPGIAYGLILALKLAGYLPMHAKQLREANALLEQLKPDLVILDINLPDGSGFDFCQTLLQSYPRVPVIMLTARTDEESAVKGLNLGAVDYIRKPSGTREILARVDRFLGGAKVLRFGPIDVKPQSHGVTINGKAVDFPKREFAILTLLMKQAENVVSREAILEIVGADEDVSDRAIDTHLSRIRSKLKKAGAEVTIAAIYGVGYKLTQAS